VKEMQLIRSKVKIIRLLNQRIKYSLIFVFAFGLGTIFIKYEYYGTVKKFLRDARVKIQDFGNPEVKLDKVILHVAPNDWNKIKTVREQAIENTVYDPMKSDYVQATLQNGEKGDTINCKLRLKGALPDHWEHNYKWSFRVKIKDDDKVFGVRKFSLQHPKTRDYIYEWLALQFLEQEGVVTIDYRFIDVEINGTDFGVYAFEQHMDKALILNGNRKDGPILRFNAHAKRERIKQKVKSGIDNPLLGALRTCRVDGDNIKGENKLSYQEARNMLDSFRKNESRASDVFDVDLLAIFLAYKDLIGSSEIDHNDLRFYFNPTTKKLEPIGFDLHTTHDPIINLLVNVDCGVDRFFIPLEKGIPNIMTSFRKDSVLMMTYATQLRKISKVGYLEGKISVIQDELDQNVRILRSEYYSKGTFSNNNLLKNRDFIQSLFQNSDVVQIKKVEIEGDSVDVSVANIQNLPVIILGIEQNNGTLVAGSEGYLEPIGICSEIDYKKVSFHLNEKATSNGGSLVLLVKLMGSNESVRIRLDELQKNNY
jgi:hypothetical protein